jgi:hypothetical protein
MRKALFIGALVMPALTPQAAPAQCGPYYGGRAYDSYPWSMSAYYPPMYRQSYAYTPQVYRESYDYSQPNYRQQYAQQPHAQYSHGQPSSPQSYSTARPAYSTESPTTIITVGAYDNRFEPRTLGLRRHRTRSILPRDIQTAGNLHLLLPPPRGHGRKHRRWHGPGKHGSQGRHCRCGPQPPKRRRKVPWILKNASAAPNIGR